MYEETTGEQGISGDSSCDDEEEQKDPPPEPTRFGWIQGVMVGRVSIVLTTRRMWLFMLTTTGCIFSFAFLLHSSHFSQLFKSQNCHLSIPLGT